MIFFITTMSLTISLISCTITHPVSLISVILIQAFLVSVMSHMIKQTAWFALIVFLVFLGGVMVIFVYIASLASNENFLMEFKQSLIPMVSVALSCFILVNFYNSMDMSINLDFSNFTNKIYSLQFAPIVLITIIYLLLTLMIVVEIIKQHKAPLRAHH